MVFKIVTGFMRWMQEWYPERCYMITRAGDEKLKWRTWERIRSAPLEDPNAPAAERRYPSRFVEPYLERVILKRQGWFGAIFLHRFWAGDRAGLHDHPFSAVSLPLAGVFREMRPGRTIHRSAWIPYFIHKECFHRIELFEATEPGSVLTLFVTGRYTKGWGFFGARSSNTFRRVS